MAPLQTPDVADQMPSRHEPHLLAVPTVPVDPYVAWCSEREGQRAPAAPVDAAVSRRRRRYFVPKEPWERILVKLSGDRR